ncbi:MAG: endolytic transglycosylase MltG [Clostridiales bacterium]|nr:endolytic transglycosylase MltG [Eubacteriales bacterium]MDH7564886.1 endolytic transglycosylase MltG [Clostridiales bacterium]
MGKKHGPGTKRRKKGVLWLVILVVGLAAGLCAIASYNYITGLNRSNAKEAAAEANLQNGIPIEIPVNSNTASIANLLKEKGIVQYPYLFKILSRIYGYDGMYQSGIHILDRDPDRNKPTHVVSSYNRIMRILAGKPQSIRVTIVEGKTYGQIVDLLVQKKLVDREKFDKAAESMDLKDFAVLKDIPQRENRLEGYLFPDTYEFSLAAGEEEIVRKMLENFAVRLGPQYQDEINKLNDRFKKYGLNMNVDMVITLASIIEREAKNDAERAKIAGVFYNRLTGRYGAPRRLESCATIQYIYLYKNTDTSDENKKRIQKGIITDKDTAINDPYNTYKFTGLPPGPICCPGKASIEAALHPEETKAVYFVANKDQSGNHVFSETLRDHNRAVRQNALH